VHSVLCWPAVEETLQRPEEDHDAPAEAERWQVLAGDQLVSECPRDPSISAASATDSTKRSGRSTSAHLLVRQRFHFDDWRPHRDFATLRADHALRDSRSPSRFGSRTVPDPKKSRVRNGRSVPGWSNFVVTVHQRAEREPQRRSEREPH
jgi:hypothetical protein